MIPHRLAFTLLATIASLAIHADAFAVDIDPPATDPEQRQLVGDTAENWPTAVLAQQPERGTSPLRDHSDVPQVLRPARDGDAGNQIGRRPDLGSPVVGSEHPPSPRGRRATKLDRLVVVGDAAKAQESAGSAQFIDQDRLEQFDYSDVQRVLRQVPGVYAIDEEGFGLRPNIGIRGSGTDRSSRITLMEDGVLIAPAPYAAPAAYYFPTMARMSALEVRKGSSAIKTGPRTTGGALNLVSTPIPDALGGMVDFAYGSDQTTLGHAFVGGRGERTGFLLETVQQNSDGFKRLDSVGPAGDDTGYNLQDYVAKFLLTSAVEANRYQELEFKIAHTEQDANETYLGLTDADFRANPNRRYAGSQLDNITTTHEQYELRHRIALGSALDLTTVAYRTEFKRNWFKLNDVGGIGIARILDNPDDFAQQLAWIRGASSPDDAFGVRNNRRSYYAHGVQSVLGWQIDTGEVAHQIEFSARYHEDQEDRLQDDDRFRMDNGRLVLTRDGAPGTQDNRIGEAEALALYLQDEMRAGRWIVTPGLRFESVDLTRTDFVRASNGRELAPTRIRKNRVSSVSPGIGVTWLGGDAYTVFASVHRGFSPPAPGVSAEEEKSTNTELGMRWHPSAFSAELTGFWNHYSNLVGTCTESSGGGCTIGDQFDAGKTRIRGVEASLGYDFGRANGWALGVPLSFNYTYTDAEFRSSFLSEFEEFGEVRKGDRLAYLPEQMFHAEIGLAGERWNTRFATTYHDRMRTVAGRGAPLPGQATDDAWVFDLAASYAITKGAELFLRVENLFDENFIASLRPAGARPARPRATFIGIRSRF